MVHYELVNLFSEGGWGKEVEPWSAKYKYVMFKWLMECYPPHHTSDVEKLGAQLNLPY